MGTYNMNQVEAAVTNSWASFFIDTEKKKELLYKDFIVIYHTMYNMALPEEPIEKVVEFFSTEFKKRINLADCTLREADFHLKILVYLSCQSDCPTQESTISKIKCLNVNEQRLIYELIQDIDGLVKGHAKTAQDESEIIDTPKKHGNFEIMKTLEESFSNDVESEERWKDQYNTLRRQHVSDQAEIQELNDRLEQCYEDVSIVKNENAHLQSQISENSAMKLQLEDYKVSNGDLVDQLAKSRNTILKMNSMAKNVNELENALAEKESENAKLKEDLLRSENTNAENKTAKLDYRREYHEKSRLLVENTTLQSLMTVLRAEVEGMKQERRNSLLPRGNNAADCSFEAMPSLASEMMAVEDLPSNEEMEELKAERRELVSKVENNEMEEKVMHEQLNSQVEEITKLTNEFEGVKMSLERKTEQLDSLKTMFQKFKYDSESKYEDHVHEHRQELMRIKSDFNTSLFVSKKASLDKDTLIKKLERMLETQKERLVTAQHNRDSPSPLTPVIIKRYRTPKTPSHIPRLITPKKSFTKDVDAARIDEMSKRNQAAPPHLRSTYPTEVQYYEKPMNLDSTGRITNNAAGKTSAALHSHAKPSAAFEIPNSPKSRTRRREALQASQKKDAKKENNPAQMLQFSPPQPRYKRKKP